MKSIKRHPMLVLLGASAIILGVTLVSDIACAADAVDLSGKKGYVDPHDLKKYDPKPPRVQKSEPPPPQVARPPSRDFSVDRSSPTINSPPPNGSLEKPPGQQLRAIPLRPVQRE